MGLRTSGFGAGSVEDKRQATDLQSPSQTIYVSSRSKEGSAAISFAESRIEDRIENRYVYSRSKRAVDLVIAGILLVASFPVLLIIAALVKLTSPGPVIFKQQRNGIGGCFNIYKFRTMHHRPEEGEGEILRQASRGDARVTRVGYWLRRLSLDELPQIINVLQGKMAIVGPRPHALSHDQYYAKHITNYMLRYQCRPGITGLAQTSGARGETGTHADMQRRVHFDLEYIASASLWMDMKILVSTAQQLVKTENVY